MGFRNDYVRAFVLLSGGIDSTTALYEAKRLFLNVSAISINYGQRHKRELDFAKWVVSEIKDVDHEIIVLPDVLTGGMLTDPNMRVPEISYANIKGLSPTYVPFRNGTMLSVLAARASKYVNRAADAWKLPPDDSLLKDLVTLYFGAHAEDAAGWAYPDCTPEFVGAMANAIYVGTYNTVRLVAPYIYATKADIIRRGTELGVPYAATWSCYVGGDVHCGVCPTCRARKDAFRIAGVDDPTVYAA